MEVGEVTEEAVIASQSFFRRSTTNATRLTTTAGVTSRTGAAAKMLGTSGEADKANKLFCRLAEMFYERFKKEDTIDARRKADFIENGIPNAPPLTGYEQEMIEESMKLVEDVTPRAKRIAGTVNESVEKFLYRDGEGGAAVGMTVAKIDVDAATLFTELWLLDTYARKAENKNVKIREVNYLDGTRGLQYTNSVSLPGGFQDRVFNTRFTWVERVEADMRRTFIIAFCPLEKTYYNVDGAEQMYNATIVGAHIFSYVTKHTCEWTWVQQVDLKISLPARVMDIVAKQQLRKANDKQEKFRRNGKEVDREKVTALTAVMEEQRGVALMEDQAEVFERCEALNEETVGKEEDWKLKALGWKDLDSPSPDVKMWMKYFPPKKGERSVGTGRAVGVIDCSAEEFAAWQINFCSNERIRISNEEGNPARLMYVRKEARLNEVTVATVKKFPFMLDNREFVTKQIWRSEEGKVVIAFEPVREIVDYGVKLRKTRASTKGLWVIEDLPPRGGAKQVSRSGLVLGV